MFGRILLLLLVCTVIGEEPVTERIEVLVRAGEVVDVISPGYPDRAPVGSNINWYIIQEDGGQLVLECEDIRISPSEGCVNGYFTIYNGRDVTKQCDVLSDLRIQSVENTMRIEFDVNWASGMINCKVSGISDDASAMAATPHPGIETVEEKKYLTLAKDQKTTIQSAGYPNAAPMNSKTIWEVTSESENQIYLECNDFRTNQPPDCTSTYLQISDGEQDHQHCESTYLIKHVSTGNQMRIEFSVGNMLALFSCLVTTEKHDVLETPSLTDLVILREEILLTMNEVTEIRSPEYPQFLQKNEKLVWEITGDIGTQISLVCDDIRITESEDCKDGYLMISEGVNEERFCNSYTDFTVQSKENIMRLELHLPMSSGIIHCKATAVQAEYGQVMHSEPQVHFVNLQPDGDVYDEIYYKPLPPDANQKWNFETSSPYRLSLHCNEYKLAPCSAKKGHLIVKDTDKEMKFCGNVLKYDQTLAVTSGNKLMVELETGSAIGGYSLDCLVQAISGNNTFEYRNVAKEEVDSSEYGRKPGPRKTSCNCGWTAKSLKRIVNGEKAEPGEFPWIVSMKVDNKHHCGGSIITEHHVLTAGHCVYNLTVDRLNVFVGTVNNSDPSPGQSITVKDVIFHDDFYYVDDLRHDVAILLLNDRIHFTNTVGPICLTSEWSTSYNQRVTAMGWGAVDPDVTIYLEYLKKTRVRVVNTKVCSFLYGHIIDASDPYHICIWGPDSAICSGDSGSPLAWLDPETNMYTLLGIVSFSTNCTSFRPSVFVNAPRYYNWIQRKITETVPNSSTCQKI